MRSLLIHLWTSVRTKTIANVESARVSVPSLFVETMDARLQYRYVWRTDLAGTQPYWEGMGGHAI